MLLFWRLHYPQTLISLLPLIKHISLATAPCRVTLSALWALLAIALPGSAISSALIQWYNRQVALSEQAKEIGGSSFLASDTVAVPQPSPDKSRLSNLWTALLPWLGYLVITLFLLRALLPVMADQLPGTTDGFQNM